MDELQEILERVVGIIGDARGIGQYLEWGMDDPGKLETALVTDLQEASKGLECLRRGYGGAGYSWIDFQVEVRDFNRLVGPFVLTLERKAEKLSSVALPVSSAGRAELDEKQVGMSASEEVYYVALETWIDPTDARLLSCLLEKHGEDIVYATKERFCERQAFFCRVSGRTLAERLCRLLHKQISKEDELYPSTDDWGEMSFKCYAASELDDDDRFLIDEQIGRLEGKLQEYENHWFIDASELGEPHIQNPNDPAVYEGDGPLDPVHLLDLSQRWAKRICPTSPEEDEEQAPEASTGRTTPSLRVSSQHRPPNATEQAIIDYLFREGFVGLESIAKLPRNKRPTGERIVERCIGRACDGQFKTTLRHMRDLGWLDNGRDHGLVSGYFLTEKGAELATVHRKSGPSQD